MKPVTLEMAKPSGERERFVAVYEEHGTAVLSYARRRVGADAADDVLAETFLVAWRRRRDVPRDALPWLYAVAGNVVRNRLRSDRRHDALHARMAAEPMPAMPAQAPDPKLRAALE